MATRFQLNTGATIPAIGVGTAFTVQPEEAFIMYEQIKTAVLDAIKIGYRHFDTACVYGSEAPLGEALAEAFRSGLVTREEVFVTSKLWCDDHEPEDVGRSVRETLSALQLDYLDLYLIHWPVKLKRSNPRYSIPATEDRYLPLDLKATWSAMEKAMGERYTKAIGVSNFSCKKLEEMLKYAYIRPAVNQVEMHPGWQQKRLREFCRKENIHITAWSPLGGPGTVWGSRAVIQDPVIGEIAETYSRSRAQVILRWGIEQGVSVVPKSFNKERLEENFQIFNWQLGEEDHQKVSTIDQKKLVSGEGFCNASTSPYKSIVDLWDGEI